MRRWRHRSADTRHASPESDSDPGHSPPTFDNEFDAYLGGSYIEWLASSGQAIPTWAWVNRIAHSTFEEVQRLASEKPPPAFRDDVALWQTLTGVLANEVLARVGDEAQLFALQREVLVPLELRLAEHWWSSFAPIDIATAVLSALPRH